MGDRFDPESVIHFCAGGISTRKEFTFKEIKFGPFRVAAHARKSQNMEATCGLMLWVVTQPFLQKSNRYVDIFQPDVITHALIRAH